MGAKIPEDDAATFAMLSEGHGIGVFQLESSGMRQMIRQLKPRIFDDLVPVVALYRPGPLQSGMVEQFIECRHGRRQVTYLDERLEPILRDTYGVMLYQEQILQISMQLGGFTPGDAEKLRKAMSKKIADLMDTFRGKFVSGAVAKGIKQDVAGVIYDQMAAFAAYGFNKAHSAAYGALAYETAYLKANYSVEYISALLTSLMENKDRLASTIEECRRMNIDVLPPDVNQSMVDFAPAPNSDRAVRFGLAAIKGLSPNAIEGILRIRQEGGPFLSIFDFCERAHEVDGLNKGNLEALIKAGAFLQITPNRRQLIDNLEVALSLRQQARRNAQSGQVTLFGLLGAAAESVTPQVQYPELRPTEEFKPQEILAFEKDLLGLYVTSHPLHGYREAFRKASAVTTSDLKQFNDRDPVTVAGIVCEFRHHQTKKGDPMMFVTIEDLAGRVDVVVFKEALTKHGEHIDRERVIIIKGKVSVRVGTGSRGRKGAPAAEESDDREYSVLADEITTAQVTISDLDPWGEPQSPVESREVGEGPWTFDDGSVVEWGSPEPEGEAELHWSTRSLLGLDLESTPTGEQPGVSDVRPQRIHLEQGRGGEASLTIEKGGVPPSGEEASALSVTKAEVSVDASPAGSPGGDAPFQPTGFAAASQPVSVDLDDVSTIRDIYGVLPKKGEKIVLYPSPGSTAAEPTYNASPR
ncbi:MAG: DNA polymerase III subunit alpha, partial [Chloroflexi bacterium]|nr:DNA polymerase III subunit alpha [Chloroflexota bacterium]